MTDKASTAPAAGSYAAEWIWMPHPGHFICGRDCKFHLNTYVGGYIVSTVGEYFPDSRVREIFARSRGVELVGRGDARDADYMRKLGYERIGCDRLYETMVFHAEKADDTCCPWRMVSGSELDFAGYNDAGSARLGHLGLCTKWASAASAAQRPTESVSPTALPAVADHPPVAAAGAREGDP